MKVYIGEFEELVLLSITSLGVEANLQKMSPAAAKLKCLSGLLREVASSGNLH